MKYAFSYDGQDWNNGLYETRNLAIIIAVNSYKRAVERDGGSADKIKIFVGEAAVEQTPDISGKELIESMREQLKAKVGPAADNWFDPAHMGVFERSINHAVKTFMRELKQEPKFFAVNNVEEYTHDGSVVATLQDLGTILRAMNPPPEQSQYMSKESQLERWSYLKTQLGEIIKDMRAIVPMNGSDSTLEICSWDGLDIPEDKWRVIESLVVAYYGEVIAAQDQIIELYGKLNALAPKTS